LLVTQVRQASASEQVEEGVVLIVVDDPASNISRRLTQVYVEIAGTPSYRVSDVSENNVNWLEDAETVAVTAGASTPTIIVREVIQFLDQFDPEDESTHHPERKFKLEQILPPVRKPKPVNRIEPYA